jgi:hypothetical protein
MGDTGLELPCVSDGESKGLEESSDARAAGPQASDRKNAAADAGLSAIVHAWPALPDAVKRRASWRWCEPAPTGTDRVSVDLLADAKEHRYRVGNLHDVYPVPVPLPVPPGVRYEMARRLARSKRRRGNAV